MIEKFCNYLTNKIRKSMPEVTDERAEVINYGLQLVIGEVPKIFIMLLIAYALGILKLSIISFLVIMPYRTFAGGFHLKTHIGCIIGTTLFYCGNVILSQHIILEQFILKAILVLTVWAFSICMIKLYAPADTENVPIISKKDRKHKQIMSYITMTFTLLIGLVIKNSIISNMLIFGVLIESLAITRFAYKITKNKYGYEEYYKNKLQEI